MHRIRFSFVTIFALFQLMNVSAFAQNYGLQGLTPITRTYGFAGTLFDLGAYYSQTEATANPPAGNSWDNHTSVYDFKLGYISLKHYYFGLLYSLGSDNQVSVEAKSRNTTGAGLGYFGYNGFNFRMYYLINSTYGDYEDGKGFQADLGYAINPSSRFYMGLTLSHRQVTYSSNQTISNFSSYSRSETYPFIMFGVLFH